MAKLDFIDGRTLQLIHRFPVRPRERGQSLYWHRIDSQPCTCDTLHGHCYVVSCTCPRHESEIGAT